MIKKLRWRFVWINMSIVTVMLIVIFTLVLTATKTELEYQSQQIMQAAAMGVRGPGIKDGPEGPKAQLPYFTVQVDRSGTLIASGSGYYDFADEEFLEDVMTQVLLQEENSGILPEYALRFSREETPRGELLDNAGKYALPASVVRVGLTVQGKQALLMVANQGQPMSREDLKNIFKRFYRVDKTRAMDGSYGLGLAIAESIVGQHGGKIWAQSNGGWNTFFVQLPLG